MNENIDLTKILKDCPKGWEFYSSVYGEVKFNTISFEHLNLKPKYNPNTNMWPNINTLFEEDPRPIKFTVQDVEHSVSKTGEHIKGKGECTFFPSKEQRDWSKFTAPWYKKEKFDPKTLQPFDKVLVKGCVSNTWKCGLFSHVKDDATLYKYSCAGDAYAVCIPYNDDTKHLVGTAEEAPEFYRYWED